MPRATSKIFTKPGAVFDTLHQQNMNKEIILICIIMACTIAVLIAISLCYIAYEKWKRHQDLNSNQI